MRLKYLLIPLILITAANAPAFDGEKNFGIGVIAGDPDGITAKYMLKNDRTFDFDLAWKTSGDDEYQSYGDYLFNKFGPIKVPEGKLLLHFGGGDRFITYSEDDDKNIDDELGFSLPVGIEYVFWKSQLGAFLELVPVLCLTPDREFGLGSGIGISFFF